MTHHPTLFLAIVILLTDPSGLKGQDGEGVLLCGVAAVIAKLLA